MNRGFVMESFLFSVEEERGAFAGAGVSMITLVFYGKIMGKKTSALCGTDFYSLAETFMN